MKDIFKISLDQAFVRDPTSELSPLLLSLGGAGGYDGVTMGRTVPLRKPKKKGAGGLDRVPGSHLQGVWSCRSWGLQSQVPHPLLECSHKRPSLLGSYLCFLPSLPSLEFPVQSRSKGSSSLQGWFLTSRPRRECWSLGLLISALVFFPEPSPRGGGGRLHIWVPESAGMR